MNDLLELTVFALGVLVLVLVGIIVYLLVLLGQIEQILRRLRRPEVGRDGYGRPLRERL